MLQRVGNTEAQNGKQENQVEAAEAGLAAGPVELRVLGREGHVVHGERARRGRRRVVGRRRRRDARGGRLVHGHQGPDHGRGRRAVARGVALQQPHEPHELAVPPVALARPAGLLLPLRRRRRCLRATTGIVGLYLQ
jgi:hypothetical protein